MFESVSTARTSAATTAFACCVALVAASCSPQNYEPILAPGPALPQLEVGTSLTEALGGLGSADFTTLEYRHEVRDPNRAAPVVVGTTRVRLLESSGPVTCVRATFHARTPHGEFVHRVTDRVCGVHGLLELLYDSTKRQRPEIRFLERRDRIEALDGSLARLAPGRALDVVQAAVAQNSRGADFSPARSLTYRESIRVVDRIPMPRGAPAGLAGPCWRLEATTREPDGFEDVREIVFAPSLGAAVTTRRIDDDGVAEDRRLVAWTPRDPAGSAKVR